MARKAAKTASLSGARDATIPAAPKTSGAVRKTEAPPRQKYVGITMRFPYAVHNELRKIAFHNRIPIATMIYRAIEEIARNEGNDKLARLARENFKKPWPESDE